MSEKIVLVGGAGFIGSALLKELGNVGQFFVIDNLSFGKRSDVGIPDERFFRLDILDHLRLAEVVRAIAPNWVIHLAAIHYIPYCNANPYEASNINLQGTLNVLDALRDLSSVKKVFFASTAAVYADSSVPVSEAAPTIPLDLYGLTKLIGERLVWEYHLKTGVPCVIGRLFNAYGPRETNPHLIPEILRQIQEGKRQLRLGNVSTRRDYIHTSDMARAILQLVVRDQNGVEVFNIGSGCSYTAREVVQEFERAANCTLEITVDFDRVRKQDRALLQADIGKIRQATGWKPQVSFQDGIAALLQGDCVWAS